METIVEKISVDLVELNTALNDFISTYSKVKRIFFPGDMAISFMGDYSFEDLKAEALPTQDKLYKKFNATFEIIEFLLSESPGNHLKNFYKEKEGILKFILQDKMTDCKNINDVITTSTESINKIKLILNSLYIKGEGLPMLVPDTNALYSNLNIEDWNFKGIERFTLVITPSVLKDLDKHKIEHRNENIRSKAIKLINQIKEYRRRGKLTEGVIIKKDKISLQTTATEPNFSKTLQWLDPINEDDRLIAELLELMKINCDKPVLLITADINLQNKCESINLPFIEPPVISEVLK